MSITTTTTHRRWRTVLLMVGLVASPARTGHSTDNACWAGASWI